MYHFFPFIYFFFFLFFFFFCSFFFLAFESSSWVFLFSWFE
ncbi:unnamed protein product, partial [Vitis vinifera]|uniref:Uncharacterized protein n=1 Tax=Vitis vinifera TaxID=29760 RepID=D7SSI7_VITVI